MHAASLPLRDVATARGDLPCWTSSNISCSLCAVATVNRSLPVRLDDPSRPGGRLRTSLLSAPHPAQGDNDSFILCAACRRRITTPDEAVERCDAHCHVFCNPAGLLFRIGLFRRAPGCVALDPPSSDFSWFSGYVWRAACCRGCGAHLGWRFDADTGDAFYGIILARIVMESDEAQ